jgi:hypothetical protein
MSSQDCGACSAGTSIFLDKTANAYHGIIQNGAYNSLSTANIIDCPNCADGAIAITTNPANQSVSAGETATFTVVASGNNLAYQWYYSSNGGSTFAEIDGATENTYSFNVASTTQNGWQFKCFISNGCDLKSTPPATLNSPCLTQVLSAITGPAAPCVDNYFT